MSLRSYKPLFTQIKFGNDESFGVRGLNSQDIAILVETHSDTLDELFRLLGDSFSVKNTDQELVEKFDTKMAQVALHVAQKTPQFLAAVIALASAENQQDGDFIELMKVAQTLPMPIQVNAVIEIAQLTFHEVGGIKKFISQVSQFLVALKPQKASLQA